MVNWVSWALPTLRKYVRWGLVAIAALILVFTVSPAPAQHNFPPPRVHPLPEFAQRWPLVEDYFGSIQTTGLGYLLWSEFPVTVYVEQPSEPGDRKFNKWLEAVRGAIADWQEYFPLVEVSDPTTANITLLRQRPPRNIGVDRDNQRLVIPDARHGEARYEFYLTATEPHQIAHRFRVFLSPEQSAKHLRGTARHELGHALGLWGHSPDERDVMYAQQVGRPPAITGRDLSTLRRIYGQATQLGWPLPSD